ncbi:uncharacterized protein LOC117926619 [Vitis riparia]|uniref:uncharacterized protein LOC117926619 n=1 Tax=Vitis riparia TaxID=96939 RepID=UPI00155A34A6|nr:uncharacterized protein LOC117926619 [Vitis riparia]
MIFSLNARHLAMISPVKRYLMTLPCGTHILVSSKDMKRSKGRLTPVHRFAGHMKISICNNNLFFPKSNGREKAKHIQSDSTAEWLCPPKFRLPLWIFGAVPEGRFVIACLKLHSKRSMWSELLVPSM